MPNTSAPSSNRASGLAAGPSGRMGLWQSREAVVARGGREAHASRAEATKPSVTRLAFSRTMKSITPRILMRTDSKLYFENARRKILTHNGGALPLTSPCASARSDTTPFTCHDDPCAWGYRPRHWRTTSTSRRAWPGKNGTTSPIAPPSRLPPRRPASTRGGGAPAERDPPPNSA